MSRRFISLLLLPAVLLTQWVSAGRCLGCEHERDSHVHLSILALSDYDDCENEQGAHIQSGSHDQSSHRHEGIVHLPSSITVGWVSQRLAIDWNLFDLAAMPTIAEAIAFQPSGIGASIKSTLAFPDCPIYLRTSTLII